jgi:hypothetical protein
MKRCGLLAIFLAVMGLSFTSPLSAQSGELEDIIIGYCDEVLENVEDTIRGLENATQDLSRCDNKLDDCASGRFGSSPARCFSDFGHCITDGSEDAKRECNEFTRELSEDTKHAQNQAESERVSMEFETWFKDAFLDPESCLAPARETAAICSGGQQ